MHTVLRSQSKEVTIGPDQPFCIIGERINPTGRKAFAEALRAGDLSEIVKDVEDQIEGGAHVLDVNMGVPLTDEADLLSRAITLVQEHTDLPICIDSSVVEALEAGLDAYEGKALVNSVTCEDERLERVLPMVKEHGAAIICLTNDETGIPQTADERLEVCARLVDIVHGRFEIPLEDMVIDPLAMTVGADPQAVVITLETISRIRDDVRAEHDARRLEHLLRAPGQARPERRVPHRRVIRRPHERDHGRTNRSDRRCVPGRGPAPRPRRVGNELDRGAPRGTRDRGGSREVSVVTDSRESDEGAGHHPARVTLRFEPSGTSVRVPPGVTVFDAASWNGIAIDSTCGGHGTCKKCRVRICDGSVPVSPLDTRAFDEGELEDGWRLACRAETGDALVIEVPPLVTRPKAATAGVGRQVILRPALQKRYLELSEPRLDDQRTDFERVRDALDDLELRAEIGVLRRLPSVLRSSGWRVTAVIVDDLLIDVEAGDTTDQLPAIAFDLGTTTVVATLLDLGTGTPLAVRSMLNRQQPFGADVISRISATMLDPTALERLTHLARDTMQELVEEVCAQAEIDPSDVYEIALAGNATMTEIALGVDPEPVGVAPFIMAARSFPDMPASELGLSLHPQARATIFPALGGYVGGDIVAGLLATGMTRDSRLRLFIDVGTNCEIALGSADGIVCTAAPAGPAFEAAQIRCGMRAADGAIEVVRIKDDAIELDVIGGVEPLGLCGSGLVDAASELVRAGLLDSSGRFVPDEVAAEIAPALSRRLVARADGERIFVLHWQGAEGDADDSVYFSQRDVRELQFAKAAIATGWKLLVEELGIDESEIQQVLLAGSFGSYLSPASAVRIGLVPKLPLTRIVSAGNVAGEGAKMALLSMQERHAAAAMIDEVEYIELSDRADFNDRFIEQLAFPGER